MLGFLPIGVGPESVPEVSQHFGGGLADQAHSRHHLSIVHPGRTDHPDRAPDPVGHLVGSEHEAAFPQSAARILAADDDLDVLSNATCCRMLASWAPCSSNSSNSSRRLTSTNPGWRSRLSTPSCRTAVCPC